MHAVKHQPRQFIRGIGIVDETSCGPLCQHPACWRSNERREKGFPNITADNAPLYGEEDDLPAVTVYNMLEDYGESPQDRYPRGQPAPVRPKPQLTRSALLPHTKLKAFSKAPANTPSLGDSVSDIGADTVKKTPEAVKKTPVSVKNVEVQEVFDLEDLSNTWESTFLAKQYYVWVPNPNWKPKSADSSLLRKTTSGPQMITPRDMTEELVPYAIEEAREATITRRHTQNRSRSPFRYYSSSPRQPALEDVDIDGINELLDLPRDILMKVLDHCQPSDLRSKEKIIEIVRRFMPNYEASPIQKVSAKNEGLKQSKVQLHDGRLKNVRQPTAMAGLEPVFQLDQWPDAPTEDREEGRELGSLGNREFSRYKHVLPAIGARTQSMDNFKMSSVSLGLPELPSGVRTMRAFNYRNLDLDFTLGPSVPITARSSSMSEGAASDHGTTINVNIPSQRSEHPDCLTARVDPSLGPSQPSQPEGIQRAGTMLPEDRFVCPAPPLGTPMSGGHQRPMSKSTTFRREVTMDSVTEEGSDKHTTPRWERGATRPSPVCIPTESHPSPSPQHNGGFSSRAVHNSPQSMQRSPAVRQNVLFHKEIPPQPPSSPQSGPGEASSLSPVPTVTPLGTVLEHGKESGLSGHLKLHPDLETSDRSSPVSSTDAWPTDVVENSCHASRAPTQASERLPMTPETLNSTAVGFDARSAKSRLSSIAQSEASSQLSDPSLVKAKLSSKGSRESPGPPPPSPEPKDLPTTPQATRSGRFSSKSRDSLAMAPVFEEGEESADEEVNLSALPPVNLYDSQQLERGFSAVSPGPVSHTGRPSPPRPVSVHFDIPKDAAKHEAEQAKSDAMQDQNTNNLHDDRNTNSSPGEVQREEASPPGQLSGDYPSCPPETDGRSSTYLTERDRRFTPEGLDTSMDTDYNTLPSGGNFEPETPRDNAMDTDHHVMALGGSFGPEMLRDEDCESQSSESARGGCIMEEEDDPFSDSDVELDINDDIRGGDGDGDEDPITRDQVTPSADVEQDPTANSAQEPISEPYNVPDPVNVDLERLSFDNCESFEEGEKSSENGLLTLKPADISELSSAVGPFVTDDKSLKLDGPHSPEPVKESMDHSEGNNNGLAHTESVEESCVGKEVDTGGSEEPSTARVGTSASRPEVGIDPSVLETPSRQTGGQADDKDIGHVTPLYTETSDRATGQRTVTMPTDERPSYFS